MSEYSRWRNCQDQAATMFVTTTCLGWVPAFARDEAKVILLARLADDCRYRGAILHAYCIMEHHLHLVLRAPLDSSMSKFLQSFKAQSAKEILAQASPNIRARLRQESKDGRSLWKRSFRGIPIRSERVFWGTIKYVHLNPVRAGMCERPEDYVLVVG